MNAFADFARTHLVPAAQGVLLQAHAAHKSGADIDIVAKRDGTPASRADRDAEQALRAIIREHYPDHGIVGEEFPAENSAADYVWVLDPLDGTKEFLALEAGWGTLIGLLHKGRPVLGVIHDSLNRKTWIAPGCLNSEPKDLKDCSIACTSPSGQFTGTDWEDGSVRLFAKIRDVRVRLNCLGFAYVADGTVDLGVENKLKLHDIVALLPVLWSAGAVCRMPGGRDYRDYDFSLRDIETQSYGIVTGRDPDLVEQALTVLEAAA